jgi:3-oxoacyl-[acyl-carrier-protein] synthase II
MIYPTLNLKTVSRECEGVHHLMQPLKKHIKTVLKNGFAFGGINAALVCRKV